MMCLKLLMLNLHLFAFSLLPKHLRKISFAKAISLLYLKPGVVFYQPQLIEVILDSCRYPEHRPLAEELCGQINVHNIKSRDGRQIVIRVRASPRE